MNNKITPQQKQQAISKFQEYVNTTGKQDIQGFKDFVQSKQFQKLTAEEKAKTIEQVTKEHRSITALKDLAAKLAHRIGGKVDFENNPNVDWKGYNQGNTSVLNEAYMTPDTPFHEILAHPIIRAIKNNNSYKINERPIIKKTGIIPLNNKDGAYYEVLENSKNPKKFETKEDAENYIKSQQTQIYTTYIVTGKQIGRAHV